MTGKAGADNHPDKYPDKPGIWALIPAAGIGSRMQADRPKQYLQYGGRTVIVHTIQTIARFPNLRGVVVGIAGDDRWWPESAEEIESLESLACPLITYEGGAGRSDTVLAGLNHIQSMSSGSDWVLVHDAVRPMVRLADINNLVTTVANDADGGLLALPVADTLKFEHEGRAQKTVDRSHLWRALTPQYFPINRLQDALKQCQADNIIVTDDASAMEHIGACPKLVTGRADNIKITYPADLEWAESLAQQQDPE